MKRVLVILLTAVVMFAFAGCGGETEPEEKAPSDNGALGNYEVAIKDYELVKNYDGKDTIAVSIDFTNNSDEAASFDVAMMCDAFQEGVELDTTSVYTDEESFDCMDDDTSKQIKSGKTIEIVVTKELENTTSPVDVEVEEFLGNGDKVVKTFELEK